MNSYSKFKDEIRVHNAPGYHKVAKYESGFLLLVKNEGLDLNSQYIDFIDAVGYGSFFNGSFVLFPLEGEIGSIRSETNNLKEIGFGDFVAIGYDGTTEGYYCLKNDSSDSGVYWINLQNKVIDLLDHDFSNWIGVQPDDLYNEKIYAAFAEIKDSTSILEVVRQRELIEVELLAFERQLTRPPDKQDDLLPRYTKLTLLVKKNDHAPLLAYLTIAFLRTGSSIGNDNIEYLTIDIRSLAIGRSEVVEAYLFDPFNLPFEEIQCLYEPEIDLGTKMRIKYKEIRRFL